MQRHLNGAEGIPGLLGTTQLLGTLLISRGTVEMMEEQIPDIVGAGGPAIAASEQPQRQDGRAQGPGQGHQRQNERADKILYGLNCLYGATMRGRCREGAAGTRGGHSPRNRRTSSTTAALIVENGGHRGPLSRCNSGTGKSRVSPARSGCRLTIQIGRAFLTPQEESESDGAEPPKDDAPPALSPLMDEAKSRRAPQPIREMHDENMTPRLRPSWSSPAENPRSSWIAPRSTACPDEHRAEADGRLQGLQGQRWQEAPAPVEAHLAADAQPGRQEFAGACVQYEPAEPLMRTLEALKVAFQARSVKGDEPAKPEGAAGEETRPA